MTLAVATIVEGHGEVTAVPKLLHRIASHLGIDGLIAMTPIRQKRDRVLNTKYDDLEKAVALARLKLANDSTITQRLILLLVDAEEDCKGAAEESLGPRLQRRLKGFAPNDASACVVANVMFETWIIAGVLSGHPLLDPKSDLFVPVDPESDGSGKGWIKRRMPSQRYRETSDQADLVSHLDVAQAQARSRSFDKLCRTLLEAASVR